MRLCPWIAIVALACSGPAEEAAPTTERSAVQARVEEVAEELEAPPPPSWPTDVTGLGATLEGFTSVESCLAALREGTPTEVAEGVADLRYDGFFDDICRSLSAVQAGEPAGCDALSVSTARRACRLRLAAYHGRPEACPTAGARSGRDAICVAWATRDRGLCRAAAVPDRARCRAVLGGDPAACRAARVERRARCVAEVSRYADALGDERRESPATLVDPVLTLDLEAEGQDTVHIERDVIAAGVRLLATGCRVRVALARAGGELPQPVVTAQSEPTFHLELTVPARVELPLRLPLGAIEAVLTVATPGQGTSSSIDGASGHVEITAWEPRFGGAIAGTISGRLARAGDEEVAVSGQFSTFVRDIEPPAEACSAAGDPGSD